MILAVWLLSLPFRLLAALGLRRSVILACLLILTVTAYGVAEDLGLLEPPAQAAPAPKPGRGRRHPCRLPAPLPTGRGPLPAPVVGTGGHWQGRVQPRPHPASRGALGQQLGRGLWAHAARLRAPQQGR
jgi:hypothetical protein